MKLFLRLRHWQLFLLTWGIPILVDVVAVSRPALMFELFPLMMIVFVITVFGWIWAISTELHKRLPAGVNMNITRFKLMFSVPIIYMLILTVWMDINVFSGPNGEGRSIGVGVVPLIVILHLVSTVCIFLGLRFAAKTMKSVEIGRLAKFNDYAGEFFLIWFSPIGIWILQPRLNKLSE